MAHSRLRKQSVLARSVELERSTSGAGEMLPGAVTPNFVQGEDLPRLARSLCDISDFALRAGSTETFEAEKRRARDVSAR